MDSVALDGVNQGLRLARGHSAHSHHGLKPQHRSHPVTPAVESPEVKPPSLGGAMQILKHEVFAALRARFEAVSVPGQSYAPSTEPEQTAADILQAVGAIEPTEEPIAAETVDEAGAAVDEGFDQTRALLGTLRALTSEVAESLSGVQSLVNQGLEQLKAGTETTTAVALNAEYERRERTEISILTQEGDVVKIRLGERSSATLTAFSATDGGAEITAASLEASSTSRFQIRVKGELSEEETAAINALLQQAESLVDEFFSDGTFGAFATVSELGFDTEQLASFSLRAAVRERFAFAGVSIGAAVIAPPEVPVDTAPVTPEPVDDGETVPVEAVDTSDGDATIAPVGEPEMVAAEIDDQGATEEPAVSIVDASRIVLEFIEKIFDSFASFEQRLVVNRRVVIDVMDFALDASPPPAAEKDAGGVDLLKQLLGAATTQ